MLPLNAKILKYANAKITRCFSNFLMHETRNATLGCFRLPAVANSPKGYPNHFREYFECPGAKKMLSKCGIKSKITLFSLMRFSQNTQTLLVWQKILSTHNDEIKNFSLITVVRNLLRK